MKEAVAPPELTRPLKVEKISANGVEENLVANAREREHLATRFDLVSVEKLEAKLHVTPEHAGLNFFVSGTMKADVIQRCVATLEPLPAHIEQMIKVHFASPEFFENSEAERDLDEDDMEPIKDGIIDLGELIAQHLGLALDPYPRKPDLPPIKIEVGEPAVKTSPFAKLVVLRDKSTDKN